MPQPSHPIITLTTDFGIKDWYVAAMKGVIFKICPDCIIIDVSHEVPKFNILAGAFLIYTAAISFPKDTIHVGVIDPGVGTQREPIVIKTNHGLFVGPNNGLFSLLLRFYKLLQCHVIENRSFMLDNVSFTFHGRDIFAPAAAHLARGRHIEDVGPALSKIKLLENISPVFSKDCISGIVLYIDSFGNVITNIHESDIKKLNLNYGDKILLEIADKKLSIPFYPTFAYVQQGDFIALIGGSGFLEVDANLTSASEKLKLKIGDAIKIRKLE
ncbi:MAG: SAM hydrolase/SAM-dependent halogenase family protein [Candidatus Asgardarchaeia archaeon]